MNRLLSPRRLLAVPVALLAALALAGTASAHARVSPAVSISGQLQLYSLAVPTEQAGAATTKIVMTVPTGFGIDSFVPPPTGWHQSIQQTGTGDNAIVTKVTWTGGHVPTGEDSLFQFLAQPSSAKTYTFQVQQTYSNGSIVNWAGSESAQYPAPTIEVKSSLGGGGTPVLSIVALVIGALGLVVGGLALFGAAGREGGRPLA